MGAQDDRDVHPEEAVRDLLEEGGVSRLTGPSPALSASFWSTYLSVGEQGCPVLCLGSHRCCQAPVLWCREQKRERKIWRLHLYVFFGN